MLPLGRGSAGAGFWIAETPVLTCIQYSTGRYYHITSVMDKDRGNIRIQRQLLRHPRINAADASEYGLPKHINRWADGTELLSVSRCFHRLIHN